MPPESRQSPIGLDYYASPIEQKKSLAEVVAFRFALGAGFATLAAAIWICSVIHHDYPPTITCGGTFVDLIQIGLVLLCSWIRRWWTAGDLEERAKSLTVFSGMLSAAMVFGLPPLVARYNSSDTAAIISTIAPLFGMPLLAVIFVLRRTKQEEGNDQLKPSSPVEP